MKVLFIHEVNYLTKVIYEMHEFPELLALAGDDVTFLHFPEGAGPTSASRTTVRTTIRGRVHPKASISLVTPPYRNGGALDRYLAPLTHLPALRREIRAGAYDVIVLYAVPTTGWQTVALARRYGIPVVFRALDVSHRIRRTPLSPLIRLAEKFVYRRATHLSANNPALAAYCVAESHRAGPVTVDPPPVDLSHFESRRPLVSRRDLGIPEEATVIAFMGTFFEFAGLDVVVQAFAERAAKDASIHLLLIGGGPAEAQLRAMTTAHGLDDRITFTGVVPYAELPEHLALGDVAINPFRPQQVSNLALPHKILQYMASGIPTVSTRLEGAHGLIGDDGGVTWVDESSDVYEAAVRLGSLSSAARRDIAARQKARVDELFSRDSAVARFRQMLSEVG